MFIAYNLFVFFSLYLSIGVIPAGAVRYVYSESSDGGTHGYITGGSSFYPRPLSDGTVRHTIRQGSSGGSYEAFPFNPNNQNMNGFERISSDYGVVKYPRTYTQSRDRGIPVNLPFTLNSKNMDTFSQMSPSNGVVPRYSYINNPFLSNNNGGVRETHTITRSNGEEVTDNKPFFNNFEGETGKMEPMTRITHPVQNEIVHNSPDCGMRSSLNAELMYNGRPSVPGKWPWHAALYLRNQTTAMYRYGCGGTLLSTTHILTASHCLFERGIKVEPSRIMAVLGKHFLSAKGNYEQTSAASEIVVHPRYDQYTKANDVAILKLVTPMIYTDYVRPICLRQDGSKTDIENKYGHVVGWGLNEDNMLPSELREAELYIPYEYECLRYMPGRYSIYVTPKTFCAGNRHINTMCHGDSGGGLFTQESGDDRWYIRGLVSLGVEKEGYNNICFLQHYTVFTYIDAYLGFISRHMN